MPSDPEPLMIYTWGYRGRSHAELVYHCDERGLKNPLVVDVRRRTTGRYIAKGWHAEEIRERLMLCIGWRDDYYPDVRLGNYGRSAVWKPAPDAWEALLTLAATWVTKTDKLHGYPVQPLIMICAEVDPMECHRTEVASRLQGIIRASGRSCEVKHL